MPYWSQIERGSASKGIVFRGTYHELKSQDLTLTLWDNKNLLDSKLIGTKQMPLREVIDIAFARTDMVIH